MYRNNNPVSFSKTIRKIFAVFLLTCFAAGMLSAQDRDQSSRRRSRWPWKGPELNSVVKDFELDILGGGTFKLSEHRGKIVAIELGACT